MIISRAPVRISFFGGGTDYPEFFREEGGAVLATAIDKYSYVTVTPFLSRLFDYTIRLSYRNNELVGSVDEIQHNVFRECLRLCELDRDIELHTVADLPAFTGLGSSSSFTVALLHALHTYKDEHIASLDLGKEAIHVERGILRENVGCQDQITAAIGGFNVLEFRSELDVLARKLSIGKERLQHFEEHLFLVFTGIRRKSVDIAGPQLRRMSSNLATLRAMREMVDEGAALLEGDAPLEQFGRLLHEAWVAKRSLEKGVSQAVIDEMYEAGKSAGAYGGKLLGAGGGGFLLFFASPETHPRLRDIFSNMQLLDVRVDAPGSSIIFSSGKTPA